MCDVIYPNMTKHLKCNEASTLLLTFNTKTKQGLILTQFICKLWKYNNALNTLRHIIAILHHLTNSNEWINIIGVEGPIMFCIYKIAACFAYYKD